MKVTDPTWTALAQELEKPRPIGQECEYSQTKGKRNLISNSTNDTQWRFVAKKNKRCCKRQILTQCSELRRYSRKIEVSQHFCSNFALIYTAVSVVVRDMTIDARGSGSITGPIKTGKVSSTAYN